MKHRIISVAIVATIALVGGWNYNQAKNETKLNDLALANVEALADNKESNSYYHLFPCPSSSGNECRFKESERPACHSATYC